MENKSLEHKLLLTCARTKLQPAAEKELAALVDQSPDWNYIIRKSREHRLGPLLFSHLKKQLIPQTVRETLEKTYTSTGLHNMLYLEELEKIITPDIQTIILKGPQLAQKAYGNVALRPFSDLDLLVAEKDLQRLDQRLQQLDYQSTDREFYRRNHFHLPYHKRDKINLHLEIHWAFVDQFILNRIDMQKVFSLARENELSPALNILYLILHIEKHAFLNKAFYRVNNPQEWIFTAPLGNQLLWYTDLYELISRGNISWQQVFGLAGEWKISHVLYHNLYILDKLYPELTLTDIYGPAKAARTKMTRLKKIFYSSARRYIDRADTNRVRPEVQLRPLRAADLINYLFPAPQDLADYYSLSQRFFVILFYPGHLLRALKQIVEEFIGICTQSIRKKKGYRHGN